MQFTITIPSVKDVGRFVSKVAREGYTGTVHVPSAKQCVDSTVKGVKTAVDVTSRVRVGLKSKDE